MTNTDQTIATLTADAARIRTLDRTETVGAAYTYLRVSEFGVSLATRHPAERNSTPMDEYTRQVQTLALPDGIEPDAVADWITHPAVLPELARLVEGMGTRWDGHNRVGQLTEAATEALATLTGPDSYDGEPSGLLGAYLNLNRVIGEGEASDHLNAIDADLIACPTADAAAELATLDLDADGITDAYDTPVYIGRDAAANYGRRVWQDARDRAAEETDAE